MLTTPPVLVLGISWSYCCIVMLPITPSSKSTARGTVGMQLDQAAQQPKHHARQQNSHVIHEQFSGVPNTESRDTWIRKLSIPYSNTETLFQEGHIGLVCSLNHQIYFLLSTHWLCSHDMSGGFCYRTGSLRVRGSNWTIYWWVCWNWWYGQTFVFQLQSRSKHKSSSFCQFK